MKNRIIKYGLCLLAAATLLCSCDEQIVETFETTPSLYFHDGYSSLASGGRQIGTLNYSFFYTASHLTEDELGVDVRLTGLPADEARPITLVQLNAGETGAAVSGTHYVAFDDPRMTQALIMPAGATRVLIPIIIKKTADMETAEFVLEFGLAANDFFVAGIKEKSSFTVNVTAMAVKPAAWDSNYNAAFGEWGQVKMKFIIEYLGYNDFDSPLSNFDLRKYLNFKGRELLAEYEAEHGPLYEKDGITRVVFP